MEKIQLLTEDEMEVINFNKYLLIQFYRNENSNILPRETREITIKALSEEIKLSYRATYRRVESLIDLKILISKKESKQRGKPVVLNINPKYKSNVGIYLRLLAKTPDEERAKKEEFLSDPITLNILKAIRDNGKPLNFGEICEKVKENTSDGYYLENLNDYDLIDIRYHITRKGSAFVQRERSNKKKTKKTV